MNPLCIVFGAGSIGKAVCGYSFKSAGSNVIFVDIDEKTVKDINKRNYYQVFTTNCCYDTVSGVSALLLDDIDVLKHIINADYVCTSVGVNGIKTVLDTIAVGLKLRDSLKPLKILLCENISNSYDYATGILNKKEINSNQFSVIETSVERISKIRLNDNGDIDVTAEPFIPLIVNKERYKQDDIILSNNKYFTETKKFDAYYYRKICTNNLGHAILGYMGYRTGCKSIIEALKNKKIYQILEKCLNISGEMLNIKYGFRKEEIEKHIENLLVRYTNPEINDEITRLIRNPVKKLSRDERIIGTALKVSECELETRSFAQVACAAITFYNKNDEESLWLKEMLDAKGIQWVIKEVCGIDSDKHKRLISEIEYYYKDFVKYGFKNFNML